MAYNNSKKMVERGNAAAKSSNMVLDASKPLPEAQLYGGETVMPNNNGAARVKEALTATGGGSTTQPNNPTLADFAKSSGWQYGYDQPKNQVWISNPQANKTLRFDNGSGQEYGMGGNVNGRNVVADTNRLTSFLSPAERVKEAVQTTGGVTTPQNNPYVRDEAKGLYETAKNATNTTTDNTQRYNDLYEQQKQAAIARIKEATASGISGYQDIINKAPQQFYNSKNQASYKGSMNEQAIKESMAAMGLGNSGDNISAQVAARAATGNDINALNQQEQDVVTAAQNAIAQLKAAEESGIAVANTDSEMAKIKTAIEEANRIDERNYNMQNDRFRNSIAGLQTLEGIDTNNRQLGLQERSTAANITGIDPVTGLSTADMQRFNKQYDAQQAQQAWENNFKQGTFDYQKTRDSVADQQWGKQYQMQLDQFEWQKNPENPTVKAQIINNMINDINLQRMQDPNSPENQTRFIQAKSAMDALNKQLAITPEMTVKQYNAQLDKIYADINQGWSQIGIAQQNADTNSGQLGLARDEFNAKKAGGMFNASSKKTAAEKKMDLNKSFGEDYSAIKNLSVPDAVNELKQGAQDYISAYGMDGYKRLWNTVLGDAIRMGQADEMK